jgi:hypothetical protein
MTRRLTARTAAALQVPDSVMYPRYTGLFSGRVLEIEPDWCG